MTANAVEVSAKVALHTMHAHRLWITMWMSLGRAGENCAHPGGNAAVTSRRTAAAHSRAGRRTHASHSHCAWSERGLAGQIRVIPGIHHPYDDYQSCNDRQIPTQVGGHRAGYRVGAELDKAEIRPVSFEVAGPEFDELPTR
jgi:hypothetical protein